MRFMTASILLALLGLGLVEACGRCPQEGTEYNADTNNCDPVDDSSEEPASDSKSKTDSASASKSDEDECSPRQPEEVACKVDSSNAGRHMFTFKTETAVDNLDDCCQLCAECSECKAVNYELKSQRCFLKDQVPAINGGAADPPIESGYESAVMVSE